MVIMESGFDILVRGGLHVQPSARLGLTNIRIPSVGLGAEAGIGLQRVTFVVAIISIDTRTIENVWNNV